MFETLPNPLIPRKWLFLYSFILIPPKVKWPNAAVQFDGGTSFLSPLF
jgi:hypothetical protein